jgi:aspartate racemase
MNGRESPARNRGIMKTIGLIGGMSWEYTVEYYRIINLAVSKKLGGFHSAKKLMFSVDFGEIEFLMREGKWEEVGSRISNIAKNLENGGAEVIILCTNTVHKVAGWIESSTTVPFIHIADATGEEISKKGMKKVGLLGTRYTMEEDFYKKRLTEKFGLSVVIPPDEKRGMVNDVIFNELCHGVVSELSKSRFKKVINELAAQGAEGIILGCTEIPMLINEGDSPVPLFDTTSIHALKAVDFALA